MGIKSFLSNLFYPELTAAEQRFAGGGIGSSISYSLSDPKVSDMFSLNSGPVTVNEDTALSLPIFYRCVDTLSNSFARLPGELIKTDLEPNGQIRTPAVGHPVRNLLFSPNPDLSQTAFYWKKTMCFNMLVYGNAYARIIRNGIGRPIKLKIYHPREVLVTSDIFRNSLFYRFADVSQTLSADDVIHFRMGSSDGIIGRSVIHANAELFKTGLQVRRFTTKLFENGARPSGMLTTDKKLSDPAKTNLKKSWFSNYGGTENVGKTPVLEDGMKYQPIGINPNDAQMSEVAQWVDESICSLMGFPQHMAGILARSTNNNIEHQGIEYVVHSLAPHVINFEQELDYKLLLTQEQGRLYHAFDLKDLLRGDMVTEEAYYRGLRNSAIISANEARNKIGWNPYKGGDMKFMQGAMLPLDEETGLPIYPPAHVNTNPPATDPAKKNGAAVNGHALNAN